MKKITGVKWVDFKIEASGNGVVNWQGAISVTGPDGKEIDNHTIPKMRGFSNKTGKKNKDETYDFKIKAMDIDLQNTPVYVSPECVKFNLFKDESFNISTATEPEDALTLIPSIVGLLKGYVIASNSVSIGKKSPLLMEELVEQDGKGNFEQYSKFGSKDNATTMFSKTTLGETRYIGYGSLVIEDLFFPLDDIFGRKACIPPTPEDGVKLAKKVSDFIKTLNFEGDKNPEAVYKECYVRNGSIMNTGEAGILLNNDAIDILVSYLIEKLSNLYIRQGRGWLSVDKVVVDYNDSTKPMRIKKDELSVNSKRSSEYACYYREGNSTEVENSLLMKKEQNNNKKAKKESKKIKKEDNNED